jgi:transposase
VRREGVTLCDFPPYSPDLNPIENLWKILKQRIYRKYTELTSYPVSEEHMDILIEVTKELWLEIEEEVIENCIESVKLRVQAFYGPRGYYTKY